jgi:hypothetical protein
MSGTYIEMLCQGPTSSAFRLSIFLTYLLQIVVKIQVRIVHRVRLRGCLGMLSRVDAV